MSADISFNQWYGQGQQSTYVRMRKSPGGILDLLEMERPGGDMSNPALAELVLYQDAIGGTRIIGNSGGGGFNNVSEKGGLYLSAPSFANTIMIDKRNRTRGLSFPVAQWQSVLDDAVDGQFSMECLRLYRGMFHSPAIRSALRNLWALCEEEGAPSRLLARAAGCEILAELCRLSGAPFVEIKGGLASGSQRRCLELMHARLSEDISLDELAAEAQLSPFHFARMFKQSLGVPPRVYLTQLRMEKACELLELTELSVTAIAHEVGYSSNQVLARIFFKHRRVSPSDYRRSVREQTLSRTTQ
ncbi:AraC family transcriptional regulator [Pseudoxanthomonas japonensis]|uniref:AraC family transcriptional regulator n=1 Tax=Pseudoxanthomonas japonensis TaxID=69284 RepID=UPI0028617F0A|nr:AraC family transcriptional regulator [Pseudoxanthomonas japonensis]MDR7068698.1 AraC family transcriptional regulator [Pseudoxanthomonas japonensis]